MGGISLQSIDATQLSDYMDELLINGCDLAIVYLLKRFWMFSKIAISV